MTDLKLKPQSDNFPVSSRAASSIDRIEGSCYNTLFMFRLHRSLGKTWQGRAAEDLVSSSLFPLLELRDLVLPVHSAAPASVPHRRACQLP